MLGLNRGASVHVVQFTSALSSLRTLQVNEKDSISLGASESELVRYVDISSIFLVCGCGGTGGWLLVVGSQMGVGADCCHQDHCRSPDHVQSAEQGWVITRG